MSWPDVSPGEVAYESELFRWIESDLTGRVVGSLGELKELFPEDDLHGEVFLSEKNVDRRGMNKYDLFSRKLKYRKGSFLNSQKDVAYRCHGCDNIVIGPPEFTKLKIRAVRADCSSCYYPLINQKFEWVD